MRIINVCGFGNTGCTVQADFLSDYAGVTGILSDNQRNQNVVNAPYQEFGLLKCQYSLGGVIIAKMHQPNVTISKSNLRDSLKGIHPDIDIPMNDGAKHHLSKRKALFEEYGQGYLQVVDDAVGVLPENLMELQLDDLIKYIAEAVKVWCHGMFSLSLDKQHSLQNCQNDVLGLKNDPPGAYPLLASLIPDGLTSAILRDPRDTTFDFNRHYKIENTVKNIEWHCNHYNSQINSARSQIMKYEEHIQGMYFVHDFEGFVFSSEQRKRYLSKMCGLREKVNNYFDESVSQINVGIYKSFPEELIKVIEHNCMDNYISFRALLRERELLVD